MKADVGRTRIERTGLGTDDTLSQVCRLQAFILQVVLDELRHRPVEQHGTRFFIGAVVTIAGTSNG